MSNNVMNLLTLDGEESKVNAILESIQYKEGEYVKWGKGTLDFNKVLPMPKSLGVACDSVMIYAVRAYMSAVNPHNKNFCYVPKLDEEEYEKLAELVLAHNTLYFKKSNFLMSEQEVKDKYSRYENRIQMPIGYNKYSDTVMSLVQYGSVYIQNLKEHGAMTWYDWCCYHWGTKWNAFNFITSNESSSNNIMFYTAWSPPRPVIQELSKKYPDVVFALNWANEFLGNDQGIVSYKNGEITERDIPKRFTYEAYLMCYFVAGHFTEEKYDVRGGIM